VNKKIIIGIIAALAIPAIIYAASPLFYNITTDEPLPQITSTKNIDDAATSTLETPELVASGRFVGTNDGIHNAEGQAKILKLADGKQLLRFEDFKSTNGPDLYVYLATDKSAQDYVSLGRLKANIGNQNYEIPDEVDLAKYDTALVWCKQFSVLFGSAEISAELPS
jgi:uncharacterized protein YxeA